MNRLVLALEGYARVSETLSRSHDEGSSRLAETWLRDEVCPVVQELILSRTFRETVLWSIEHLPTGCDTPERRAVEEVDRALVVCAEALVVFLEAVEASSSSSEGAPKHLAEISNVDREGIQQIASHPWFDLVYAGEFFQAERGLHLEPGQGSSELARKFYETCNWILPLGDYVARSLFVRIQYWKDFLDQMCRAALSHSSLAAFEIYNSLFAASVRLDKVVGELYQLCHQGNTAHLRNSSTALIQIYVAYDSRPHLEWLGAPPSLAETSSPMIRSLIRRRATPTNSDQLRNRKFLLRSCDPDILRQIAGALNDMKYLYEVPSEPAEIIRWALDRARLVLVDSTPLSVYWDGDTIAEERWADARPEWDLLWTLARDVGRLVTQETLRRYDKNPIKNRRNRLKRLLSTTPDLNARIESQRGTGGYLLGLDSDDIILLRTTHAGSLEIVGRNSTLQVSSI